LLAISLFRNLLKVPVVKRLGDTILASDVKDKVKNRLGGGCNEDKKMLLEPVMNLSC